MDRMGPETPQVYAQYSMHALAVVTMIVMAGRCVADFEVENPWEHFYAQIPRLPHFGTMMST
ncbi:hypothetical protein DIPPA_33787 [Diplonema papillatum]|nr:hypothetical protein DIPPA_33787 [Diplonema papillatum]